ncbi:MAG: hypothetical protein Q7R48_03915 [bacterium]|nr:hypothetical protein [bacterium]
MGARAQILVEDTRIYLYDHSGATHDRILEALANAIARRQRWDDPEYLSAIIFREMVRADLDGDLSYGLDTSFHLDLELLVRVNCRSQTIRLVAWPTTFYGGVKEDCLCSFCDLANVGVSALTSLPYPD